MAAEHAQLLASLAIGHVRPEQPGDAVGVRTEVIPIDELHAEDTGPENDPDSVGGAELQGNVPTVIYGNLRKKRKVLIEDSPRHSDFKVVPAKERSGSSKMEMRRPVRPIDRQKMRPWLKNLLDKGSVFGLNWTKREEGVFQISWRHASRLGWNLETDGDVFERWARHTGIYKDGDVPEPKRWKANFRCALHSLPDVKELTSPDDRKGRNASRTYRFLTPNEIQPPVKRKHRYSIQLPYLYEHQNSEDSGSQNSDERNSDEEVPDGQPRQVPHCDHDYAARVDKIDAGGLTTSAIFQRHGSGYVLIKSKDAHEYEFRLTSSGEASSEPKQQQQKSPPKKSPVKKRKPAASKSSPPSSSPSKRSKGKDSTKGVAKPKGGKKLAKKRKKVVNSGEKVTVPRGKPTVTLQSLLAGRQVNKPNTNKKPRPSRSAAAAAKKARTGKVGELPGKGVGSKGSGGESGQGTPTQRQGLDACMLLLEAATQLDKMDSLSSSETSTKPASSSRAPPKSAAPPTKAATTSKATTTSSASITTTVTTETDGGVSTPPPASVATVFVPAVSSSAPGGFGAVFSMPQAPSGIVQQYIGLATESTASKTPALSSLLSVATHASTPGVVLPTTQLLAHPFRVVGFINSIEPALSTVPQSTKEMTTTCSVVTSVPAIPTAVTVGAPVSQAATPPTLMQPASNLGAGTSMLKHLLRLTCPPPKPMPVTITTASAPSTSQQTASVNILPFTAPVVSASASVGGESSITLLMKEERVCPPVEENSNVHAQRNQAKDRYEIVAEVDLGASQEDTWQERGANILPYLHVNSSKVIVKQEQDVDSVDTEAVTSQAQIHREAGDSVSSRPAASVDSIMQFFNLCSANSNSQVVVKTEGPVTEVPDDVIAINSAYSSPVKTERHGSAAPQQPDSQEFMNRLNQLAVFVSPDWTGEGEGESSVGVSGLEGMDPEQSGSQGHGGEVAGTGIELHVQRTDSDDEMPVLTKEEPQEYS